MEILKSLRSPDTADVPKLPYVYMHFRVTDGRLFYIGKGVGRRAWSIEDRSERWKREAFANGRRVVIVMESDQANVNWFEWIIIPLFARLGEPLVNVVHRHRVE